ncbi:MAG: cell division protein ZapA [Oscillospiraceae bacterium]
MSNKIRLTVGGIEYTISSDDEETYVRKLGDELNAKLDRLSKHNPYLSTTMVAVVAALEFCDDAKKASTECDKVKIELKRAVEEAACARLEADEARREIERLSRENRTLRTQKSQL